MRTRDPLALVGLAVLVVVGAVLIAVVGVTNHYRFNDELLAIYRGRLVDQSFPSGLWTTENFSARGPERLTGWLLGAVNGFSGSTAGDLRNGRIAMAICWALCAVPTWLLARGTGLTARQALLPAALVALGTWGIYGIAFLNATLGVLTFTVQLWVLHRLVVRPSRRWELALLVALVAVLLARVGNAPFVLVLAVALPLQSWRDRPAGTGLVGWLKRAPLELVRTYPVLSVVFAFALVGLATVGQARLLGAYGSGITQQQIQLRTLVDQVATMVGRTTFALAVVPVAIGGWWLLRSLVRPRDRESGAFAVLGVGSVVVLVYVFYTAVIEDRYVAVLLPIVAIAFARAVLRREAGIAGTAVVAALVVWAAWSRGRLPAADGFAAFVAPGARFVEDALGGRLATTALPGTGPDWGLVVTVALGVLAVAYAALVRLGPRRVTGPATVAICLGLVVFGLAAQRWSDERFVAAVGSPQASWSQVAWIDDAVGPDATVGLLADARREDPAFQVLYYGISGFNASLRVSVGTDDRLAFGCCPPAPRPNGALQTDRETGAVRTVGPVPRFLAVPTGFRRLSFNTQLVATGPPGFTLEERRRRLALAWTTFGGGFYDDGWSRARAALHRRTFQGNVDVAGPKCWSAILTGPDLLQRPQAVTITGGARTVRTQVAARAQALVRVPLTRGARSELTITPRDVGRMDSLRQVGVRVTDDRIVRCA